MDISEVRRIAHIFYMQRVESGLPGDSVFDWYQAEAYIRLHEGFQNPRAFHRLFNPLGKQCPVCLQDNWVEQHSYNGPYDGCLVCGFNLDSDQSRVYDLKDTNFMHNLSKIIISLTARIEQIK